MEASSDDDVLFLGLAGDVLIDRADPHEVFNDVRDLLRSSDILFANLESPYSDTPGFAVTAPLVLAPRAHNLDAFAASGFHVMSLANNHIVDAGHAAMLDTRARLRALGIHTCGAGDNLEDARRPAVVERGGRKVGFLAFASVFPHGYQARSTVPGLVPLRAYNHFHEGLPQYYAPGYLPRVESIPDRDDQRDFEADIAALREKVDVVVTSFHWGDHLRPFVLTDHERRTARSSIDCGADLVIGHHHHALRGIEWYKGKPIFYGLGHFVFDFRLDMTAELQAYFKSVNAESYAIFPREGWPLLPLHPDTRMTILGWVQIRGRSITDVGFVPCRLKPDGRVIPVDPESTEGLEVIKYLAECNRSEKLNANIVIEGAPSLGPHRSVKVVPRE